MLHLDLTAPEKPLDGMTYPEALRELLRRAAVARSLAHLTPTAQATAQAGASASLALPPATHGGARALAHSVSPAARATDDDSGGPLDSAIAALMVIAEGDDEEEARCARRILHAYFSDDDDQEEKAKARPTARSASSRTHQRTAMQSRPMTRAESLATLRRLAADPGASLAVRREAQTLLAREQAPARSSNEQAILARFDGPPPVTSARAEGSSLVLEMMSPAAAAERMKKMIAEGHVPKGIPHDMARTDPSTFRAASILGRR